MALARLPVLIFASVSLMLATPSIAGAQSLSAGNYSLNRAGSEVGFTISGSMIFKVKREGVFKDFTGDLEYDPARPADTRMDLTVYTDSVDMNNHEHDEMLKSADFFDVERFPTMHFVSSSTTAKPNGTFSITGDMTIHGITKRMTIPVTLRNRASAFNASSPVFESDFQIDRTEFGLNGRANWGGFKVSISKKVDIHIAIAATASGSQTQTQR